MIITIMKFVFTIKTRVNPHIMLGSDKGEGGAKRDEKSGTIFFEKEDCFHCLV